MKERGTGVLELIEVMAVELITCGEVEDVVGALTQLLAESHKFSMIFLLSSGCCSSLRWKKGKRKTDRRKAVKWRVE